MRIRKRTFILLWSFLAFLGCKSEKRANHRSGPIVEATSDATPQEVEKIVDTPKPQETKPDPETPSTELAPQLVSGAETKGKVKTLKQLRASIDQCFGSGMTLVPQSALISQAEGEAEESTATQMLDPEKISIGADILLHNRSFLNDETMGTRLTPASQSLSAAYLSAMEVVANVIAHNCQADTALCQCETEVKTAAMFQRCLPAYKVSSASVKEISAFCSQGEGAMKEVVASLVASYSFVLKE